MQLGVAVVHRSRGQSLSRELVAAVRSCHLRRRKSQGRRGRRRGVAWDRGHVQKAELVFSVLVLVGRGGPCAAGAFSLVVRVPCASRRGRGC